MCLSNSSSFLLQAESKILEEINDEEVQIEELKNRLKLRCRDKMLLTGAYNVDVFSFSIF